MRLFLLLTFIVIALFGRDNPFFPADPNAKQMSTTNRVEQLKPYTTQTISLPNSARAIKGIIIEYQNLDGSISNETLTLNNQIDWHEPLIISQKKAKVTKKKQTHKKVKTIDAQFISFQADSKGLKVMTKDNLLRHFMLTSPHRIVMDFSRDTSFKPKKFTVNTAPFKQIRMGNHDKYYRIVIELDGQYRYKIQSDEKEHKIVCF